MSSDFVKKMRKAYKTKEKRGRIKLVPATQKRKTNPTCMICKDDITNSKHISDGICEGMGCWFAWLDIKYGKPINKEVIHR